MDTAFMQRHTRARLRVHKRHAHCGCDWAKANGNALWSSSPSRGRVFTGRDVGNTSATAGGRVFGADRGGEHVAGDEAREVAHLVDFAEDGRHEVVRQVAAGVAEVRLVIASTCRLLARLVAAAHVVALRHEAKRRQRHKVVVLSAHLLDQLERGRVCVVRASYGVVEDRSALCDRLTLVNLARLELAFGQVLDVECCAARPRRSHTYAGVRCKHMTGPRGYGARLGVRASCCATAAAHSTRPPYCRSTFIRPLFCANVHPKSVIGPTYRKASFRGT
eukprot:5028679-Prymnesium_polylepis.1